MAELKITAANFENEVLHSDKPVLLDFYADWCGPCKMLSPILHELAEEKSGALKVGKVNVDEQMELAMRFQVSSIPMLVVFKDGKAVAKSVAIGLSRRLPQWWRAQDESCDRRRCGGRCSAAARIRRLDEHAQIIMIERSGYVSYANCGLPYYVGGVIKSRKN